MKIHRSSRETDCTILPNTTIRDDRLTHMARGVLAELLSRPDGWETTADQMADDARRARGDDDRRGEGRRAYRRAFAELEKYGYMHRIKYRDASSRWNTELVVFDTPQDSDAAWSEVDSAAGRSPFPTQGQSSVVYVIGRENGGIVKIGTTGNLSMRLRQLQTSSPDELRVLWSFGGDSRLEAHLHRQFQHRQLTGEWFDFSDTDPVAAVSEVAEAYHSVPPGTCMSWS